MKKGADLYMGSSANVEGNLKQARQIIKVTEDGYTDRYTDQALEFAKRAIENAAQAGLDVEADKARLEALLSGRRHS